MAIKDCIKIRKSLDSKDGAAYTAHFEELTRGGVPASDAYAQAAEQLMEDVLGERNELAAAVRAQGGRLADVDIEGLLNPASYAADFGGVAAPGSIPAAENSDTIKTEASEAKQDEPAELDERGGTALEDVPADDVPATETVGAVEGGTGAGGEFDLRGDSAVGGAGISAPRGVGDDAGESLVSAGGKRSGRGGLRRRRKVGERVDSGDQSRPSGTRAVEQGENFRITAADAIGEGGQKTKFKQNIDAIKLVKRLEGEMLPATREQQQALALYVGWGGMPQAFYRPDGSVAKGWEKEAAQLKDLLTDAEYEAARRSTQDAHYTSVEIINAMWAAVARMGFRRGKVLEPSIGVGHFAGLMPSALKGQITGVELDTITAQIARHLYPKHNILPAGGFQDFRASDETYDLAIGNPPFGNQKLYDPKRRSLNKFSIHNFFFAKSLNLLKPNGVLAMVVSNYLLDSSNTAAREYLAERAEFLGAVRLPNNAFSKNANTEVTTDIIFLRKLQDGETADRSWVDTAPIDDPAGGEAMHINRYFVDNPDMMLGTMQRAGTMYRPDSPALIANEGQLTAVELMERLMRLPENIMDKPGKVIEPETVQAVEGVADVRVGSMFVADGEVRIRLEDLENRPQSKVVEFTRKSKGEMVPDKRGRERVLGMIGVRDALAKLRREQLSDSADEATLDQLRAELNRVYDAFVAKQGPINHATNKRLFRDDPTYPQIAALEEGYDKGVSPTVAKNTGEAARAPSAQKAAIFRTRTQQPYREVTKVSNAKDALVASQMAFGRVDMDYMESLYGKEREAIMEELRGLVFDDPDSGPVVKDEYLSGNVKAKLARAMDLAAKDVRYRENVEALEAVQPADIEAIDIKVKPGASWLPADTVSEFVNYLLEGQGYRAVYNPVVARWSISGDGRKGTSAAAQTQYGTERRSAYQILEAVLNDKALRIYTQVTRDQRVFDQQATDEANAKADLIKRAFEGWIWDNEERRNTLARTYNDTFNTHVLREFDGAHLTFQGKVADDIIRLRPHQANAVWRILQNGTTLLDHVVGAGKTFTVIAAAMEMKRMGLATKPVVVVPNHLVDQWAKDFLTLYPGANILAATKKDFEKANRRKLFGRIATGDWDAVIVAHSSFGKLEIDPDFEAEFIREQVREIEKAIAALKKEEGKRYSTKDAEKVKDRLNARLQKLADTGGKDDTMYFSELGIDALFVDEAHEFKNLAYITSMTRVAGLGNTGGSQKAMDMYLKTRFILSKTGGRNLVFATGTPISNTMAEMFTVQRYLGEDTLKAKGLTHFDAWAKQYGEVVTDWELSPSGTYKMNSRFAKFVNIPELMQDYLSFGDVINRDDINRQLKAQGKKLPVPKIKGGKPQNIVVERSDAQAGYIGENISTDPDKEEYAKGTLVYRAEHLPKKAEKGEDNMLKIMSDARKAALDMRLIDPSYGEYEGSKVNVAADRMLDLYKQWDHERGAQLVFIDLSTPKKAAAKARREMQDLIRLADEGDEKAQEKLDKMSPDEFLALESEFSVYDDLKAKLIERGIPEHEIAFIHDANTEEQKETLFGKVRSGSVRFLFGSTAKMGAGMNVQNRLVALHHMDAPWRPSDLEQREGRIIRQGNELYAKDPEGFEIEINRYATKQTLDSRMWQTIESKARFIEQVRKGDMLTREIEDVGGEAANAAEMKAASSGNPLILEEMDLRQKMKKLEGARYAHEKGQHRIVANIRAQERVIARTPGLLAKLDADIALRDANLGKKFSMQVMGKAYDKRKDAGVALMKALAKFDNGTKQSQKLGELAGFDVMVERGSFASILNLSLQAEGDYFIGGFILSDLNADGVATRLTNKLNGLEGQKTYHQEQMQEAQDQLPKLQSQVGPWDKADELAETLAKHQAVIAELRPKKDEGPVYTGQVSARLSDDRVDPDTGKVTGKGRWFLLTEGGIRYTNTPKEGWAAEDEARAWMAENGARDVDQAPDVAEQPRTPYNRGDANDQRTARGPGQGRTDRGPDALPGRTVALGISDEIETRGSTALVGQTIDSPQALADLAQVFRNPQYETFRYFFTLNGKVVHATGLTSRLPGRTTMFPRGLSGQVGYDWIQQQMDVAGADGFWILHNHPSGDPTPSDTDIEITNRIADRFVGFNGHVVINSNRYAAITPSGDVRVQARDFGPDKLLTPSKKSAYLGKKLFGHAQVADIGKHLQQDGFVVLIGSSGTTGVRAISEVEAALMTNVLDAQRTVRQFVKRSGSDQVFVYGAQGDLQERVIGGLIRKGFIEDAVTDDGATYGRAFTREPGVYLGQQKDERDVFVEQEKGDKVGRMTQKQGTGDNSTESNTLQPDGEKAVRKPSNYEISKGVEGRRVRFTRYGSLPRNLMSVNYAEEITETSADGTPGLSVYVEGQTVRGEFADRDLSITGTAIAIGSGSDGEVLIDPRTIILDDGQSQDLQDQLEQGIELYNYATYNQWPIAKENPNQPQRDPGAGEVFQSKTPYQSDGKAPRKSQSIKRDRPLRDAVHGVFNIGSTFAKRQVFGLLTLRQIAEQIKTWLPNIDADYIADINRMETVKNQWKERAGLIAERRRESLSAAENDELSRMQHEATIAGVDPDVPYAPVIDEVDGQRRIKVLQQQAFQRPGANKAALFEEISHIKMQMAQEENRLANKERIEAMWAAMKNETLRAIYREERDYHVEMRAAQREALRVRILESQMDESVKRKIMDGMRLHFERYEVEAPYFPLARFGDYWVHAEMTDENGAPMRTFDMFETSGEWEAFQEQVADAGGRIIGADKFSNNKSQMQEGVSTEFVAQVDEMIAALGNDPQVQALRDSIYQLYLQALPSMSARKHALHRAKTRGYYKDHLRAFAHTAQHGANMLGRLSFEHKLRATLDDADEAASMAGNEDKYAKAVAEIESFKEYLAEQADSLSLAEIDKELEAINEEIDERVKARFKPVSKQIDEKWKPERRALLALPEDERAEAQQVLNAKVKKERQAARKVVRDEVFSGELKERFDQWTDFRRIAKETGGINKDDQAAAIEQRIARRERLLGYADKIKRDGRQELVRNALGELQDSHQAAMGQVVSPWAQVMNAIGFTWFLGLSPAAGLVNMAQTAVVAGPLLGAKFGYKASSPALLGATKDFFKHAKRGVFGIEHALRNQGERDAFRRWHDEGLLDKTLAHDLQGISDGGIYTGQLRHRFMRAVGFIFHHAERANREITALAAYRAAIEKGYSPAGAAKVAEDLTWQAHFDYGQHNRARFMRGNAMRVITQFKQYSQNITYLYANIFKQALKGASAEEKAEARKALAGMLAMQFAVAGSLGLPLASVIASAAQALADWDDDDPRELEAEYRQFLADKLGKTGGRIAAKGFVDALTPFSLHGRLTLSDLWLRTSDRELEGTAKQMDLMKAILGPQASIFTGFVSGAELMGKGQVARGVEQMVPKFVKDPLKAVRYATKDARSLRDIRLKEMGPEEVFAQLMGFSSSKLSDLYDQKNAVTNIDNRLKDRRQALVDRMRQALQDRDLRARREVQAEIREFNRKNPGRKIDAKTISRSLRSRRNMERQMVDGVRSTRGNRGLVEGFDFAR